MKACRPVHLVYIYIYLCVCVGGRNKQKKKKEATNQTYLYSIKQGTFLELFLCHSRCLVLLFVLIFKWAYNMCIDEIGLKFLCVILFFVAMV